MGERHAQYHLTHDTGAGRLDVWPNGCWAVYRIDGDQIARRIGFDVDGRVNRRDGWCGYIGTFEKLEDAAAAIAADRHELFPTPPDAQPCRRYGNG